MIKNLIIILGFTAILISCASKPPNQQENICSIFEQKSSWYRIVNKSYEKWDAPIHVQMAIMRQESAFQNRIKPERTKLLGLIPWKRKSSALGYSQAIDATWDWYRKENNKPLASRVNFSDAVDFTGWYMNKTLQINENFTRADFGLSMLEKYDSSNSHIKKMENKINKELIESMTLSGCRDISEIDRDLVLINR